MIADARSMTSNLAKGFDVFMSMFEILDKNGVINLEVHDGLA